MGRRRLLIAAAASLLAGSVTPSSGAPSPPPRPKVALVSADTDAHEADVRAKLLATGAFDAVDIFNVDAGHPVPTLSALLPYESVLVWSSRPFDEPDLLGGVLAQFVDANRRVVIATFSHACSSLSPGMALGGRWGDSLYSPFRCGPQNGGHLLSLQKVLPDDPLLADVTDLNGGLTSYHNRVSVGPDDTTIARWSNTWPLIARAPGRLGRGDVVALNFYPPSSDARGDLWDAQTDGTTLMRNALLRLRIEFIATPPPLAASSSATFEFESFPQIIDFSCALDDQPEAACSSPVTIAAADGERTFTIKGTDPSGHVAFAHHRWTVDTTPPSTMLIDPPNEWHNNRELEFHFKANEIASFECIFDGFRAQPCVSPLLMKTGEGEHLLVIRATDPAGNIEDPPATLRFNVDVTPPETKFGTLPKLFSTDPSPVFSFSANEPATFRCALDGGPSEPCVSPLQLALDEGPHTFSVTATDRATNTDDTPAVFSWKIDRTPPNATFTATPQAFEPTGTASFRFKSTESGNFECSLDQMPFAACTSPMDLEGVTEGRHVLRVRAIDLAGNIDHSPASHTWTVDLTAPVPSITSPAPGAIYLGAQRVATTPQDRAVLIDPGSFTITVDVLDATPVTAVILVDGAIRCELVEAPFSCPWSPDTMSGEHVIVVIATDAVGRRGSTQVHAVVY